MDAAVISAIISFAFGTVLGTYLKIRWERTNAAQLQKQDYKTDRYKTIILLAYSLLDFAKEKKNLWEHGRPYQTEQELIDELKVEWNNMLLFASDDALMAIQQFISQPDKNNFRRCALAMRKDLWGDKVSLSLKDFTL